VIVVRLKEEDRQVIILALVELRRRRPGWADYLNDLIDGAFEGAIIAGELDRLHDGLIAADGPT
jgi:hypothetical protein